MLPHFIASGTDKKDRGAAIGEILRESDYDVIFFQEAFHAAPRKKILEQLSRQFLYSAGPANRTRFSLKTNSGLWVFSKYPIVYHRSIAFRTRHGIDAFSRKGALLIEININGQAVQIAGTHLQNCGPGWLKKMQCMEIYERLLKPAEREGVPQVICGDFNIDRLKESENYKSMLSLLNAVDTNHNPALITYNRVNNQLKNENSSSNDLIDYILVRDNGVPLISNSSVVRFAKTWKRNFSELSDHYSMSAEIQILSEQRSLALLNPRE